MIKQLKKVLVYQMIKLYNSYKIKINNCNNKLKILRKKILFMNLHAKTK